MFEGESVLEETGTGNWQKPSVDSLCAMLVHSKSFEANVGEQEYPPHKLWIKKE